MNARQRRKQIREVISTDKLVQELLEKYPEAHEGDVRYFLITPNGSINGKLPTDVSRKRMLSLLNRFLHPADVF